MYEQHLRVSAPEHILGHTLYVSDAENLTLVMLDEVYSQFGAISTVAIYTATNSHNFVRTFALVTFVSADSLERVLAGGVALDHPRTGAKLVHQATAHSMFNTTSQAGSTYSLVRQFRNRGEDGDYLQADTSTAGRKRRRKSTEEGFRLERNGSADSSTLFPTTQLPAPPLVSLPARPSSRASLSPVMSPANALPPPAAQESRLQLLESQLAASRASLRALRSSHKCTLADLSAERAARIAAETEVGRLGRRLGVLEVVLGDEEADRAMRDLLFGLADRWGEVEALAVKEGAQEQKDPALDKAWYLNEVADAVGGIREAMQEQAQEHAAGSRDGMKRRRDWEGLIPAE